MADLIYQADLDDKKVLQALQRIDKSIDRISRDADKHFQGIGKSAGASGVQIGAIAGAVASVTSGIIELGKRAIQTFADIAAESVTLAAKFEVNKGLIKNIFEGDEQAANAVIDRLVKKGAEIGLLPEAAVGLGVSFGPDSGSLEQLDRIIESAVKLKALAPEKSIEDIRQALEQGLSGDALALQDRLNLPPEVRGRIKELQAEFGKTEGLLKALDEVFDKFGIDLSTVADTAIGKFGKLQAQLQELQLVGGEQALESIKPFLEDLIAFLETNREELILFAASVGDSVGSIVEFVQSLSGLADLKPGDITQFGQDIFKFIEQLKLGVEIIGGFLGIVGELLATLDPVGIAFNAGTDAISNFFAGFSDGQGVFVGFLTLLAQSKAGLEGILVVLQAGIESAGLALESIGALAAGDFAKASELSTASNDVLFNSLTAGQQAVMESYAESKKALDEYTQAVDDQATSQENLKDKLADTNEAGTAAADAFLKGEQASRDAAEAAEELADAQAKVNEAMADAKQDFDRKLEDIDIAAERKRLDIQIEFAQKREDAARNNLQKLADIRRNSQQDITDAATDLERKEEDIARRFADERIDLEREQRESRLDIETSFREKLEDIQKQSSVDLEEAERNRDAVSFLRIIRQQQQQVSQAQTDRQREIDELRVQGERKKEELRIQQQREVEEAHIANERKLEDLRLNLERQIEAQNIAYAQQLEDITINEARKNEEARLARERDIEDAKLAYDRKLADLQVSMAEELAIIAAGNAAIEEEAKRHAQAMEDAERQSRRDRVESQANADDDTPSSRPGAQNRQRQRAGQPSSRPGTINQGRAFGGLVNAGQSYPVGESGPELFTPSSNGKIIPSNQLLMPSMTPKSAISNVTNNNQKSANLGGLLDANSLDTLLASKVQNILLQMLDRMG